LNAGLRIAPEVFARLPGLRVVTVMASGIGPSSPRVEPLWNEAWRDLRRGFAFPNAQSHPRIAAWRQAMKALGATPKEYPTSVESLVRRALKSETPFHVHPLVDFYNAVCLRHVVPAGGFDLESLAGGVELRLTAGGETFQPLDGEAAESVPPGEVAYASGRTVVTRHLMWRQSRQGMIRVATRRALFVSELLAGDGELADRVESDLAGGLRDLFGAEVVSTVLDRERPSSPAG
jgi:DNA/RNA-binding domain of Phe-tRNA-synthetase-like protein